MTSPSVSGNFPRKTAGFCERNFSIKRYPAKNPAKLRDKFIFDSVEKKPRNEKALKIPKYGKKTHICGIFTRNADSRAILGADLYRLMFFIRLCSRHFSRQNGERALLRPLFLSYPAIYPAKLRDSRSQITRNGDICQNTCQNGNNWSLHAQWLDWVARVGEGA